MVIPKRAPRPSASPTAATLYAKAHAMFIRTWASVVQAMSNKLIKECNWASRIRMLPPVEKHFLPWAIMMPTSEAPRLGPSFRPSPIFLGQRANGGCVSQNIWTYHCNYMGLALKTPDMLKFLIGHGAGCHYRYSKLPGNSARLVGSVASQLQRHLSAGPPCSSASAQSTYHRKFQTSCLQCIDRIFCICSYSVLDLN